jgi:cyclophilin family peptidyl-prolyl cis-trans isomerase
MKVGACGLMFVFSMALSNALGAQEKDAPQEGAKSAAKAEKQERRPEKPAETPKQPAEKPVVAADFPTLHQKWNEADKQLNELGEQYRLAASSEERTVLRLRYQKLVAESEQILPKLRAAAEAAFDADPGKDVAVNRLLMGMMAYGFRREDYAAVVKLAQKLLAGKVEDPVVYSIGGVAACLADDYDTAEKYLPLADKAGKLDTEGKQHLADLPKNKELWAKEQAIRVMEKEADNLPRVKLETSKGTIVVELFENQAPQTVGNFISLVEKKFYDNTPFHRVLPGFMAQGGDPQGNGTGGPGYAIPCECHRDDHRLHFQGTLSMAHSGKDTGGSQFFITFLRTPHLDGKHTAFGRVVEGMDVLPKLQRRNPELERQGIPLPPPDTILTATVLRKREHEYVPTKVETKPLPPKTEPGKKGSGKAIPSSGQAPGKP